MRSKEEQAIRAMTRGLKRIQAKRARLDGDESAEGFRQTRAAEAEEAALRKQMQRASRSFTQWQWAGLVAHSN